MSAQVDFAAALLDPERPAPGGLTTWNGSDPAQRFAVYRNNVTVSLVNALAGTFPVVRALVGAEFFEAMARIHVAAHPPRSVQMARYGADFGAFLEQFPPVAHLPYLADVARLEALRVTAYHAADAPSLGADDFGGLAPADLGGLRLNLHPSVSILRSRFAIVSLWAAHQGILPIESVDPSEAEDALIVRPQDDVLVLSLPPGVAEALRRIEAGHSLGAAVEAALACAPDFDPSGLFRILIESGAVSAIFSGESHVT